MSLIDKLKNKFAPISQHQSDYLPLIDAYIDEAKSDSSIKYNYKLSDYEAGKQISDFDPDKSLDILLFCIAQTASYLSNKPIEHFGINLGQFLKGPKD
jgi:hypothetical protein